MNSKLAQVSVTQKDFAARVMEHEPQLYREYFSNINTVIEAKLSITPNQRECTVTLYSNGAHKGTYPIQLPCSFVSVQVHTAVRALNDLLEEASWLSKCTALRDTFLEKRASVFALLEINSLKEITSPYSDTNSADLCYKLALEYHEGQVDKAGNPYINHPVALAKEFSDDCLQSIALLHDVLEDTDCTSRVLRSRRVPEIVISSVEKLTHKEGTDYFRYVDSLIDDPCALLVKLADLSHNMDLSRLKFCDTKAYNRCLKYNKAIDQIYNSLQIRGGKLQWH